MLKRPKPGEDESDILRMQEEFLKEKKKNCNLQPAAQVVNLRSQTPVASETSPSSTQQCGRKLSKYAQTKGLKSQEKRPRLDQNTSLLGDIVEKNSEVLPDNEGDDDKVYYPKVIPSVMGKIVEKNVNTDIDFEFSPMPSNGFPVATKWDPNKIRKKVQLKKPINQMKMHVDETASTSTGNTKSIDKVSDIPSNIPIKSYILNSPEASTIHCENVEVLSKLSEKEILEEQQKLLSTLDPKLVDFIKSKRKIQTEPPKQLETMEVDDSLTNKLETEDNSLWENDVLSHPEVNKWLHFDSLEKDKLEWMKGVEESKKIKAEEPYEARFDFNGYLLPYTMEYTEKTKSLFHHGEESHRPGYSLEELFELTRSSVLQQRAMALNTLAGILEYYSAGTYKNIIEIPLTKIFFIIRIAVDENKAIILEPALKALRNLLFNRIDEASLDALVGFKEGTLQPCLENDKSEIEELESKESDLKDFHLAEIDLIAAVLRTDILQRLYYILDVIKPSFNSVQYVLQILTRLARDSVETCQKIVETEHLMKALIHHFLPSTSINFAFDPQIIYNGKPILAALKFLRVISLQNAIICQLLIDKYNVLKPIAEYISSGVDGTYGLRIQIESFCILSNMLHFGLGCDVSISLGPVISTALYKHVQGTNMFVQSSIPSATHAAVLLQFLSRLLYCKLANLHELKNQIYPLLKEGVQKWMSQLSNSANYTCGHLRLLCSVLDCCMTILTVEQVSIKFLNESLKSLAASQGFREITSKIILSSNLLSGIDTKDLNLTKNLMSLGSTVIDSDQKVLPVLNIVSPIPFLASLFKLLVVINDKEVSGGFLEKLLPYLNKIASKAPSLTENWFTRMETDFLLSTLKLALLEDTSESNKDLLYILANKLCYILRIDKLYELESLFNDIIFNKKWFTAERLMNLISLADADGFSKALNAIDEIKQCYTEVVNLNYKDTGPNVVLKKWQEPILPRDWIYLPILTLYSKSQEPESTPKVVGEHASKVEAMRTAQKEMIVSCCLEWILFNELCFPDLLKDIDVTDRFCRIMCVFLCDNSLFLDEKIKIVLRKCIQTLFRKNASFNFDKPLTGLNNFQDFYTQFLEQFQSVSYGDPSFAACVLVPLAQSHNVKWRKLLWSEYAGCLRALDCPEEMLCYELKDYLYPCETDVSLLKSYHRALTSYLLRPGTITYKIADHHVREYKAKMKESVKVT